MGVHTLLLRLAGPMQAWGTQSRFTVRDTGPEPSKSGVIGLLCAALGRRREEPLDDLNTLRLGVRIDREGLMAKDYHTTLDVMKATGKGLKDCEPSTRYYLADANFLAGLEGDDLSLLQHIETALQNPHWPLFLGRKSFPPGIPVWIPGGLKENTGLKEAMESQPWEPGALPKVWPKRIRLVIETAYGQGEAVRVDRPISFAERRFTLRHTCTGFMDNPKTKEETPCISPV